MNLIIDTREQRELSFENIDPKINIIRRKLDAGDYSLLGFEDKIAVERKSASDLFGTLTSGHKRFKREIERAKDYDFFYLVVEEPILRIRMKEFPGAYATDISGDQILQICFTMQVKYGIRIIFCEGRNPAALFIYHLFKAYAKLHAPELKLRANKQKLDVDLLLLDDNDNYL